MTLPARINFVTLACRTLAVNCEDMAEVELVYATVKTFDDVHELEPPIRASWGGGFSFRDPAANMGHRLGGWLTFRRQRRHHLSLMLKAKQ